MSFQFVLNKHREALSVKSSVISVLIHVSYRCAAVYELGFAEAPT